MEKAQKERLIKVAGAALVIALGSRALKHDFPEESRIRTVRYLEASKALWYEIIENGTMKATKLVALIRQQEDGTTEIEIPEDQSFSEKQIVELEEPFPGAVTENNTLQNG